MIDLFATDEYWEFGITSILDIEKIPYQRTTRLDDFEPELLMGTTETVASDGK